MGDDWKRRWKALDREERRWVREAALTGDRQPDAHTQQLVAGYCWRQLTVGVRAAAWAMVGWAIFIGVLTFSPARATAISFLTLPS